MNGFVSLASTGMSVYLGIGSPRNRITVTNAFKCSPVTRVVWVAVEVVANFKVCGSTANGS
ncbi:hypothetical protein LC593_24070 [Nostoc sp. CHAB 5844]|nr:hypothetical protein [Nostoc sp. CHAB 5844]